jgi:CubicO group peptidase (beta-lactamase class C family)
LLTLTLSVSVSSKTDDGAGYWPKESWRTSTPEEQGMDSERIYAMLQAIQGVNKDFLNLHSMLIIRNGYLVTEAYFAPYHKNIKQHLWEGTASFISALTGIAIQKGLIKDTHQKVLDFFPEYALDNLDDRKKALTIGDLLSMTAGIGWFEDWRDSTYRLEFIPTVMSADPALNILNRPMADEPGVRFNYFSGAAHLLSAIVHKTSGTSTLDFANQNLFKPLGISGLDWEKDFQGVHWGFMRLYLTPEDMAKFGYLYLRQGVWDGKQIIPAEWIALSTREHTRWKPSINDSIPYGYMWWIFPSGYYSFGWGDQLIYVIPKSNLVVVFTSSNRQAAVNWLLEIMERFVIPAVKSDGPLPANPKIATKLQSLLKSIETPDSKPVPPLPAIAAKISAKVIQCEPNSGNYRSVSLRFDQKNACLLKITYIDGGSFEYPVGLDGVYRITEESGPMMFRFSITKGSGPVALKGAWVSDHTFVIDCQILREPENFALRFDFNQGEPTIQLTGSVIGTFEEIKGKLPE